MARLIDADKLVGKANELEIFYFTGETDIAVHDCQMVELGAVLAEIDEAPTVDAVPVVHGRWVHHYHDSGEPIDDKWYCSECHMCNDHRRTWYCPNCGAKMDGDGNG